MNSKKQESKLQEAFFAFDCPPNQQTFIFKLTNPEKIQEARDILSGKKTDATSVMGIIIKKPVDYNPGWSFHYDPNSVSFFSFATEVCDASIEYVEEHLDEIGGSFLPDNRWCPWCSQLTKEIPVQDICTSS